MHGGSAPYASAAHPGAGAAPYAYGAPYAAASGPAGMYTGHIPGPAYAPPTHTWGTYGGSAPYATGNPYEYPPRPSLKRKNPEPDAPKQVPDDDAGGGQ